MLTAHLLAHTHWDREWYHPAVRFRGRLVALIDALLAAPPDALTPFLLDGQAIILTDYLAARPEQHTALGEALRRGTLEAGPWYVLGDTLIPSGEALVRNLEAGRRTLARFGAAPPPVAYCPDTFGHPAALPSIAAGFGHTLAVVWRGAGGASFPPVDTVRWRGPDRAELLCYHLPPDGYEFGSALPDDPVLARARWQRIRETLASRNRSGHVILTVGADHHAPDPALSAQVAQLATAAVANGDLVRRATLREAADALRQAAEAGPIPVIHGELRDSYGYTWTLPGTLATRAGQKRRNAQLERRLLRDVEPALVLARLHAPATFHCVDPRGALSLAQLPTLLARTWETLLATHPHDTLCGCSIDAVAADCSARQREVAASAAELTTVALAGALGHDPVVARGRPVAPMPRMVVHNRTARERSGLATLRLIETVADVPVGPGSAPSAGSGVDPRVDAGAPPVLASVVQPLAIRDRWVRRESPQHYPDNDRVRVHQLLAWVPPVPAFGLRVLDDTAIAHRPLVPSSVEEDGDVITLRNGRLELVITPEGVALHCGARTLPACLRLETVADAGDSYTPSLRGAPEPLRLRRVRVGMRGPLRSSVRLWWSWHAGAERVLVRTELMLDADSELVRCDVRGLNARRDHRLQWVWRSDLTAHAVTADAAFGPVSRTPVPAVPAAVPFERPPSTMPLHRWMMAHTPDRGVTVFSDGLAEGEAVDGRLAVTLVRAIGELSRADLPERPGHAGWPAAIPVAQCQGRFAATLGILVHGPLSITTLDQVEAAADALLLPLTGESWRDLEGPPRQLAGPSLTGPGLVASAVTLTACGTRIILRAVNVTEHPATGHWRLPDAAQWRVRRCRLDGTPAEGREGQWRSAAPVIDVVAAPREIITLEVAAVD